MDLVVDKMDQLEHVHISHGNFILEGFARPPVVKDDASVPGEIGKLAIPNFLHILEYLVHRGTFEDGSRNAPSVVIGHKP